LGDLLRRIEHADGVIVEPRRLLGTTSRHGGNLGQGSVGVAQRRCRIASSGLDEAGRHALFILQQCLEQMFRADPLMAHADGDGLCALQEAFGTVGKFFEIHVFVPSFSIASPLFI
jgi:hypothetical protein